MLTAEHNELLTRIGPGTPCGELLRRYWHPVCIASQLTEERPRQRIKVLDEELVLFRGADGRYGLLGEHCSHRGVSLYYGFLEDGCIRCPYHGWLYDRDGRCVEQPFEPAQSMMKHTIRHPAYPVEELGGLLFAYLGPPEVKPLLPRWDILVREGARYFNDYPTLNCSWLQAEENTADVTHTYFLHGHTMAKKGLQGADYYYRPFAEYGFQPFEWGLLKDWIAEGPRGGPGWGNLLIFPNMLRLGTSMHWRVPIDDTHTRIFWLDLGSRMEGEGGPSADGASRGSPAGGESVVRPFESWKDENGEYPLDSFSSQDTMAWETQGPIFDRTREHLGSSDRGVVLFRQMLMDSIEDVQQGRDPRGIVRDPERNQMIDLREWFAEGDDVAGGERAGRPSAHRPRGQVFDGRHEVVQVPYGKARPAPVGGAS